MDVAESSRYFPYRCLLGGAEEKQEWLRGSRCTSWVLSPGPPDNGAEIRPVGAASFLFNHFSVASRLPALTAIVLVIRIQDARRAVNMYRLLARSTFLSHIYFDSLVLKF
jgi:hypothetical protein